MTKQNESVDDTNNQSVFHANDKGYESASVMQFTVVDDAAGLPIGSKARFAVYRPELPGIGEPLNYN